MTLPLAADAALFLADFAEPVVYRPAAELPRTIQAVVDRSPPRGLDEAPGVALPVTRLTVINDPVAGVAAASLDTGLDRFDVPVRCGGPATSRAIVPGQAFTQDAGMLTIEVR